MVFTYYSSTNCVIKIQDTVATEIFSLQFGEQEQVLPVYSWNDRYFHSVGGGNVLVTGTVIFNAVYPNYLELLIARKPLSKGGVSPGNITALSTVKRRISEAMAQADADLEFDPVKLLELARMNETYDIQNPTTFASLDSEKARQTIFDLMVEGPTSTDLIKSCRLTGRATEVNAGDANNIKYAQTFIGQRIKQTLVDTQSYNLADSTAV